MPLGETQQFLAPMDLEPVLLTVVSVSGSSYLGTLLLLEGDGQSFSFSVAAAAPLIRLSTVHS